VSGLLAGIRRQPLLCEGDLVARILTRHEVGDVADTSLRGHGQSIRRRGGSTRRRSRARAR